MMPRKIIRWITLVIVVCFYILGAYTVAKAGQFNAVAMPVKTADMGSIWAGPDAQNVNGKMIYLFTFPPAESNRLFQVRVDPDSGVAESFYTGHPGHRPNATQSTSSDNDGWRYGDWNTMAYRFNPATGAFQELAKVGLIWDWNLNKAVSAPPNPDPILADVTTPDGKRYQLRHPTSNTLWVQHPTETLAHLWKIDGGVETDLGVVPTRKWWQYPQMTAGPNNKLYFSLAIAEPDIIVYNPATQTETKMLSVQHPSYTSTPAWTTTALDANNVLYYFLYECKPGLGPRQAFRVDDTVLTIVPNTQFPGYTGDDFPYTTANPPSTTLADGRVASYIWIKGSPGYNAYKDRAVNIYTPSTGTTVERRFDYSSPGTPLFGQLGKDPTSGKIYGMARNRLGSYAPATGKSEEVGTGPCYSQVYASVFTNGKLFTFSYGNGLMAIYDPTQPWNYGTAEVGTNPRDLGFVGGPGGNRLFNAIIRPADGKIYAVSNPVNGYWGGSLIRIDPVSPYTSTYWWNTVIPKHVLQALTLDPGGNGIWIGSSPFSVAAGDIDNPQTDTQAKLALWDIATQQTTYTTVPITGMLAIEGLLTAPNGLIYGLGRMGTYEGTHPHFTGGKMFVWNPTTRQVVYEATTYQPLIDIPHIMELGTDGLIYAMCGEGLTKINPANNSWTLVDTFPWPYGDIRSGPFIDGTNIYFIIGSNLVRYTP